MSVLILLFLSTWLFYHFILYIFYVSVAHKAISMRFCDNSDNLRGPAANLTMSIFLPLLFNAIDIYQIIWLRGITPNSTINQRKIKYHGEIPSNGKTVFRHLKKITAFGDCWLCHVAPHIYLFWYNLIGNMFQKLYYLIIWNCPF